MQLVWRSPILQNLVLDLTVRPRMKLWEHRVPCTIKRACHLQSRMYLGTLINLLNRVSDVFLTITVRITKVYELVKRTLFRTLFLFIFRTIFLLFLSIPSQSAIMLTRRPLIQRKTCCIESITRRVWMIRKAAHSNRFVALRCDPLRYIMLPFVGITYVQCWAENRFPMFINM